MGLFSKVQIAIDNTVYPRGSWIARFVKHYYRIYIKEEQQYDIVTIMITDIGWKD